MIPLGRVYQQSAGESIHRKDISKIQDLHNRTNAGV